VGRVRGGKRSRQQVQIGAPDESLTAVSGMVAVTELCERLGVIEALDAAVGPIKARERGRSGGELLVGLAAAQLAGEDHLVGLDRQRADVAGQALTPASVFRPGSRRDSRSERPAAATRFASTLTLEPSS
jgi:hypothetical protein